MCYKVAANVDGKLVEGYVRASALEGLDTFEKQRQAALSMDLPKQIETQVAALGTQTAATGSDHPGAKAIRLMQANQPRQALAVLEEALKVYRNDPNLLSLAGLAAYRTDDMTRAIGYWRESLALDPNPSIERWVKKAEKEMQADKSSEKLYGMRFLLRYENAAVPPDIARAMVAALEEEYSRISFQLGCRVEERIITIVQSRDAYLKTTDAAEWSGGQFDGTKIRIALLEKEGIGPNTRRAFAHEIVHACLAGLGAWPAWLHEGLAQKLSGESTPPQARSRLASAVRAGSVPKLGRMSQTWSRMSADHAALAYAYALVAAETMLDLYRDFGLQNLLRNPAMLSRAEEEIDRFLRQ
jgi:tetratricopeptide (TPR) repeat protein